MYVIVFVGGLLYYHDGDVEIKQGQVLKEFQNWGPSFRVEADITVNKQPISSSIFHFTANDNHCCDYGDRIPYLFEINFPILFLLSI